MGWTAAAAIGGSLLSGKLASNSADKAAKQQNQASDQAIAEQQRQFDITQQSLQPFQQTGADALDAQRVLLGLGSSNIDPNADQRSQLNARLAELQTLQGVQDKLRVDNKASQFNPSTPSVRVDGPLTEAEANRLNQFSGVSTGPVLNSNNVESQVDSQSYGTQYDPRIEQLQKVDELAASKLPIDYSGEIAGIQSQLDSLGTFTKAQGTPEEQQAAALAKLGNSPAQLFLRGRAEKALLRNSAATGNLKSGNVLSALQQQGIGFAQQDLQNEFNRLGSLTGAGQNAATQIGQFGQNLATNTGNQYLQQGANNANALATQNQGVQGTINTIANQFGQAQVNAQSPIDPLGNNFNTVGGQSQVAPPQFNFLK